MLLSVTNLHALSDYRNRLENITMNARERSSSEELHPTPQTPKNIPSVGTMRYFTTLPSVSKRKEDQRHRKNRLLFRDLREETWKVRRTKRFKAGIVQEQSITSYLSDILLSGDSRPISGPVCENYDARRQFTAGYNRNN
ncbi:hypothetical protein TcasGA2_TC009243 [Tribolium castaneum]|uniref:Uncharacterized protein n=1 Tax=Tribolium castaneum TaxID=7070 RepID=D6WSH4_TRICA|nr:hypothetical protein TcasGA2_TC009243 [Tribolium castaneum]